MNELFWVLTGATLVPAAAGFAAVRKSGRPFTKEAGIMTLSAVAVAAAGYASIGHFGDWQVRTADEATDWQLAARLTEARRAAKSETADAASLLTLAQAYYDGGKYAEAVDVLTESESRFGETSDAAALKAEALYYREGRKLTAEVKAITDRVLAANPYQVPVRLLLANDAFLNERWTEAIREWEFLLQSGAVKGRERAIENAIAKARYRRDMASKTNQ